MFIHVQDPPLNRNIGKYQLPHIWDYSSAIIASILNLSQLKDLPTNAATTPLLEPPSTPYPSTPSLLSFYVGGHHSFLTFIPIGKYMRTPPYTPLSLSTCRPTAVPPW